MTPDQESYRRAYQEYLRWNEQDLAKLPCNSDLRSPAEEWHAYLVAMVNLDWDAWPESADWARVQKLADMDHYYACLFRLEAWRRAHAKSCH